MVDKLRAAGLSSAKWRGLGQRLTPRTADLDAIGVDCSSSDERLEKVVDEFLSNGEDLSWEALAKAVAECRGGGRNIARKLLTSVGKGIFFLFSHWTTVIGIIDTCLYIYATVDPDELRVPSENGDGIPYSDFYSDEGCRILCNLPGHDTCTLLCRCGVSRSKKRKPATK